MSPWIIGIIIGWIPGFIMMFRRSVVHEMSRVHKRIINCILCTDGCVCTRCREPEAWTTDAWPITHHTQEDHKAVLRGDTIALAALIGLLWPFVAIGHLVVDGGKFLGKWFWRMLFPRGVQTAYTDQLTRSAKEREYADMIERSAKLDADIERLSREIDVKPPTTKDQS